VRAYVAIEARGRDLQTICVGQDAAPRHDWRLTTMSLHTISVTQIMAAEEDRAPSSIGRYALDESIDNLTGLTEFSPAEYLTLPKRFSDEQIFSAEAVTLLRHKWGIAIGARSGYIRKIFAENTPVGHVQAEAIFLSARAYWRKKLGEPTEETPSRVIWDTKFGNVIVARRDEMPYVSMALTSRLEVRSDTDREAVRVLRETTNNSDFVIRLGLSDSQLARWLWLRAAEWSNLPSFASQPIVPILFIFFYWPFVLAGLFVLDVLWSFVRYKYVNVRASSYMANFVILTKWPAAIASAIILFVDHRILAGSLAIAWPLGLGGLIAVPGQIGKLQILFAKKIGPLAELVINDSSNAR
jgi:hypothetical protein